MELCTRNPLDSWSKAVRDLVGAGTSGQSIMTSYNRPPFLCKAKGSICLVGMWQRWQKVAVSGGDLCSDASVFDWTEYPRAAAVTVSGVALTVDARNQEISALSSLAWPDPFLYCATPRRKGSGSFPMQCLFCPRSLQGVNVIVSHPQVLIVRCEL